MECLSPGAGVQKEIRKGSQRRNESLLPVPSSVQGPVPRETEGDLRGEAGADKGSVLIASGPAETCCHPWEE